MNNVVVGGVVGGGLGYLAGGALKHPLIGLVGGLVLGSMVGSRVASAALPPSSQTSNGSIVLSGGDASVGLVVGLPVTISLPPGASWTSGNQTPTNVGTNGSYTWNYQGPGTLILDWVDASGQPQETTLTLFNAAA